MNPTRRTNQLAASRLWRTALFVGVLTLAPLPGAADFIAFPPTLIPIAVEGDPFACALPSGSNNVQVDPTPTCLDELQGTLYGPTDRGCAVVSGHHRVPTGLRATCLEVGVVLANAGYNVRLSTNYANKQFGGKALMFYGTTNCDNSNYRIDEMPKGWNDRISSVDAHNRCTVQVWEHIKLDGKVRSCNDCQDLSITSNGDPDLDDKTSSMYWYKTG